MVPASIPAPLVAFVADELMRVPMLVDQVAEAAGDAIRRAMPGMRPHERAMAGEMIQKLVSHRHAMAERYLDSLREQMRAEQLRLSSTSWGVTAHGTAAEPRLSAMSLVDEDEVAIDVEISHTIEAVRSIAEYELRELQTFVSALVGDMDVTRDHNPLRAETHARALWAAAQALPMARGWQLAFMRHAGTPLAQVLRKTFASACSRLEQQGVEPAAHRTLVLPSGSRRSRWSGESTFAPDLARLRDGLQARETVAAAPPTPVSLRATLDQVLQRAARQTAALPRADRGADHGADYGGGTAEAATARPAGTAADAAHARDPRHRPAPGNDGPRAGDPAADLASHLFDAVLADRGLDADLRPLLERLRAPLVRLSLREPGALDLDTHPAWRFVERLAFVGELLPHAGSPARAQALDALGRIVEPVVAETQPSAALHDWALERLAQFEHQRFEARALAAAAEVAELQSLESRIVRPDAGPSTLHAALDIGHMDTVPAELLDAANERPEPPKSAHAWISSLRPASWVRMFLQGRWVLAQLLWPGERGELFLFAHAASDTTWAVRRGALATLHAERLADTLAPRRLVREAAKRVMRQMLR